MVIRAVILSNDVINGIRLRIDVDLDGCKRSFANNAGLKVGESLAIYFDGNKAKIPFCNSWAVHEIALQKSNSPDLDSRDDLPQPCNYYGRYHSEQD